MEELIVANFIDFQL